jgi:hypothetical protein
MTAICNDLQDGIGKWMGLAPPLKKDLDSGRKKNPTLSFGGSRQLSSHIEIWHGRYE